MWVFCLGQDWRHTFLSMMQKSGTSLVKYLVSWDWIWEISSFWGSQAAHNPQVALELSWNRWWIRTCQNWIHGRDLKSSATVEVAWYGYLSSMNKEAGNHAMITLSSRNNHSSRSSSPKCPRPQYQRFCDQPTIGLPPVPSHATAPDIGTYACSTAHPGSGQWTPVHPLW